MINHYYVAFPFKGEYQYTDFNANMIANEFMRYNNDAAMESILDDTTGLQYFYSRFSYHGKNYVATFSYYTPKTFNIYELSLDENGEETETIVERDVPWILLKITDGDENILYNVTECI